MTTGVTRIVDILLLGEFAGKAIVLFDKICLHIFILLSSLLPIPNSRHQLLHALLPPSRLFLVASSLCPSALRPQSFP